MYIYGLPINEKVRVKTFFCGTTSLDQNFLPSVLFFPLHCSLVLHHLSHSSQWLKTNRNSPCSLLLMMRLNIYSFCLRQSFKHSWKFITSAWSYNPTQWWPRTKPPRLMAIKTMVVPLMYRTVSNDLTILEPNSRAQHILFGMII